MSVILLFSRPILDRFLRHSNSFWKATLSKYKDSIFASSVIVSTLKPYVSYNLKATLPDNTLLASLQN